MIGYACAYLRYYYPVEFITAYLNSAANDDDLKMGTELARQLKINMLRPTYGFSRAKYFCDAKNNNIYKGIGSLKNLSKKASEEIVPLYDKEYNNFIDVLFSLKEKTSINSRQLDILIKINFFKEFGDINKLLSIVEFFDLLYNKKSIKKDSQIVSQFGEDVIRKYSESETQTRIDEIDYNSYLTSLGISNIGEELQDCIKYKYIKDSLGNKEKIPNGYSFAKIFKKYQMTEEEKQQFSTKSVIGQFSNINTKELLKYIFNHYTTPTTTVKEIIKYESEYLGYIDYQDERLPKKYFVVQNLDTKYSPKFTAYCISNGVSVEMRVRKKKNPKNKNDKCKTSFTDKPFEDGDILYLISWGKEPKMKKTEDGWEKDPSTMYNWLYDYDIRDL